MKSIALLFFITLSANAITFEVIGPCSKNPLLLNEETSVDINQSVMEISNKLLDENNIEYIGASNGIVSIDNSPYGLEAMEVISDTKMRSHGWCYLVNGNIPDILSSDYFLESQEVKITWIYGYSFYDSGKWIGYCDPTWKIAPKQFCK